jgi:hypothetical protein
MTQEEIGEVTKASNAGHPSTTDEDDEDSDMMTLIEQPEQSEFQAADDEDYLESDYELLESPLSLLSCTMINLRVASADQNIVSDHIIVCGIHPSIYYFILPLRAKYLHFHKPIVILNPEPPSNEIWESINRFPNIWYIKGSPKNMEDLYRANIGYADKAIIFANTLMIGDDSDMCDSETTLIYKALNRAEPGVQVIVEIVNTNNLKYLEYDREIDEGEELKQRGSSLKNSEKSRMTEEEIELVAAAEQDPLFAAGEIYVSSIIDTLTCQSYYNPHIVTVIQQILTGGRRSNSIMLGISEQTQLKQSNLYQMNVPEDFLVASSEQNETFGDLFNFLSLEKNLIPLALYRQSGATDNQDSYVLTNPPENVAAPSAGQAHPQRQDLRPRPGTPRRALRRRDQDVEAQERSHQSV